MLASRPPPPRLNAPSFPFTIPIENRYRFPEAVQFNQFYPQGPRLGHTATLPSFGGLADKTLFVMPFSKERRRTDAAASNRPSEFMTWIFFRVGTSSVLKARQPIRFLQSSCGPKPQGLPDPFPKQTVCLRGQRAAGIVKSTAGPSGQLSQTESDSPSQAPVGITAG